MYITEAKSSNSSELPKWPKTCQHTRPPCWRMSLTELTGVGWCVCVRIDLCGLKPAPREGTFSNETPVPHPPALGGLSCFLCFLWSPWRPCAKWDFSLLRPTVQSCDVGLSQSPCSAGQCFKGSGNRFPSQEPASKLESSVVWFGFHSSLQRTEPANLYIHVSINSNRCTFDM